ncbi:MAG: glutamine-hydrolyzing carbamoyl-phosphate synthase small subunit [Planctomycetota bacterium]
MAADQEPARLILEDGTVLHGRSIGAPGKALGELVFNTSHTGYQEILTDPSYRGQVVLLTCPHIGNYGICAEDDESARPWLEGLVVREAARLPSNFRAGTDLSSYLRSQEIVAIDGIDTRLLTRKVRSGGEMRSLITTDEEPSDDALTGEVRASAGTRGRDLVSDVTRVDSVDWKLGYESRFSPRRNGDLPEGLIPIVAIDCGIKRNILRSLVEHGFRVRVVPAGTPAEEILASSPCGVFISNGPGDPSGVPYLVETMRELTLAKRLPTFGICLGHQILSLVLGGRTYKMRFGHHGGNHPVKELATGRIDITSQNHSYAVDADSLPGDVEVTHLNLNDGSVEGLRHEKLPVWSVQYHPEAAPGPHDALGLFARFRRMF